MTVVTEKNVSDALTYLADDPHPVAKARHDVTIAENKLEALTADLYPATQGSVKERECEIERNVTYRDAKLELANAQMALERHRARVRAAEMLIDVWRSENANARVSERVR